VYSRQIFKGCDISSAKITEEEMEGIVHHGIDMVDLETEYSVYDWQQYCFETIEAIKIRGNIPMLAGGTMLWLDAVTLNYDFDEKGTKSDRQCEPRWPVLKLGLQWPRETLYERINQRAQAQFENGLIEETKQVLQDSPNITKSAFTSFGYLEIEGYLNGIITYDEALIKNQQRNRNYAKKQLTWWRGRDDVIWLEPN
jgi:tRNA dimethylallyltransferase